MFLFQKNHFLVGQELPTVTPRFQYFSLGHFSRRAAVPCEVRDRAKARSKETRDRRSATVRPALSPGAPLRLSPGACVRTCGALPASQVPNREAGSALLHSPFPSVPCAARPSARARDASPAAQPQLASSAPVARHWAKPRPRDAHRPSLGQGPAAGCPQPVPLRRR